MGVVVNKRWGLEHKRVVIFSFPTSLLYGNCKGQHQEEDLFPPCMVSIRLFLLFFLFLKCWVKQCIVRTVALVEKYLDTHFLLYLAKLSSE